MAARGNGHKSRPLTPASFYEAVHAAGLHDQDDRLWCDCGWSTAVGSYEPRQLAVTLRFARQHASKCIDAQELAEV